MGGGSHRASYLEDTGKVYPSRFHISYGSSAALYGPAEALFSRAERECSREVDDGLKTLRPASASVSGSHQKVRCLKMAWGFIWTGFVDFLNKTIVTPSPPSLKKH